ncbi:unnamed protein product [Clonostachys byssicola]|uniref:Uncharacterized protein n=1 Tax=Clonostachys byssicola TaxID=160290 RepID=A0A9N9Y2Y3_9HYPO|nr:unnamed protein product [Clonostachys byssicola]
MWSKCIPDKEKGLAETNSVNELVQQKAWKDTLCIDPLLWTRAQCRLVSCQFKHDLVAQNRVFPPGWWAAPGLSNADVCKIHADVHGQLKTLDNKFKTLKQVLNENGFEALGDERDMPENIFVSSYRRELSFIYHDKSYAKVAADAIFTHTTGHNLAYVDLDYARSIRRQALGAAPPSFRAGQHASAFVGLEQPSPEKPRHDAEDPYIVALLIALAQKQRQDEDRRPRRQRNAATQGEPQTSRLRTKSKTPKPQINDTDTCYTVTVVAVPEKAKCLYCYTATFPMKFLQKLYEPSEYTPSDWVTISYFKAPMREKIHLVQMLIPTMELINSGRASIPPSEGHHTSL